MIKLSGRSICPVNPFNYESSQINIYFMSEGFLELWRPLVPPWILQHVLDQLVLVRLQVNPCSCVSYSRVDPDPYVFRPPGSGSVLILYGSGSFRQQV
jgi:hypothetical protein